MKEFRAKTPECVCLIYYIHLVESELCVLCPQNFSLLIQKKTKQNCMTWFSWLSKSVHNFISSNFSTNDSSFQGGYLYVQLNQCMFLPCDILLTLLPNSSCLHRQKLPPFGVCFLLGANILKLSSNQLILVQSSEMIETANPSFVIIITALVYHTQLILF